MTQYRLMIWVACWTISALFVACGTGLLENERFDDTDRLMQPDSDTITVTVGPPPDEPVDAVNICPTRIKTSCNVNDVASSIANYMHTVVSAKWLNSPATFSHAAIDLILGEYDDTREPFAIRINFETTNDEADFASDAKIFTPETDTILKGHWTGAISAGDKLLGSDCQQLGVFHQTDEGQYRIFGVPRTAASRTLVSLETATLKTESQLHGAVYLAVKTTYPSPALKRLCLFGEGLWCFDGNSWIEELSSEIAPEIVDVAVSIQNDSPVITAVDASGLIFTMQDTEWTATKISTSREIRAASTSLDPQFLSLAGDGILAHGNPFFTIQTCPVDINAMAFHYFVNSATFVLLTEDGDLYRGVMDIDEAPELCGPLMQFPNAVGLFTSQEDTYVVTEDSVEGNPGDRYLSVE